MKAEKSKFIRPQFSKWDGGIFTGVYTNNEYHIVPQVVDGIVVDIGAHIGSFSALASEMGALHVVAIEANPSNATQLSKNMVRYPVRVIRGAAWRSDKPPEILFITPVDETNPEFNTGGVGLEANGIEVGSVNFDEIIGQFAEVKFLKLDCEGSEFPILYTSKLLGRVRNIAMEWHILKNPWLVEGFENTPKCLCAYLESLGFKTKFDTAIPTQGHIFATRL